MEGLASRLRLIVITDERLAGPRTVDKVVRAALGAGATAVQLRNKAAGAGELAQTARRLGPLCRGAGALFFVNDRVDVAVTTGADGVHLGPDDLPIAAVRTRVGDGFLVGYSADDPEEARQAERAGADYIGCGTVFPTRHKADAGAAIGLERLDAVARAVAIPVVAIGGITPGNVAQVARTRACGIAVIGAVMEATDPAAAVRALLEGLGERERYRPPSASSPPISSDDT